MKRFVIAVLIGLAAGYILIRMSQRQVPAEELSDDTEPDIGTRPAPRP